MYRVLATLGSGGMGTVYRAEVVGDPEDEATPRHVALKVIHTHLLDAPAHLERFLREAEIGAAIQHPNVVGTYGASTTTVDDSTVHYLALELVEGQTLRELLDELELVPEELCRHIGAEIARGLEAIHAAGAVHRDLKPENVLITPDHTVKIMDLGIAHLVDRATLLSQTGQFVGSLRYAAPEQLRSAPGGLDARADLHALGALLYELATHVFPFEGDEVGLIVSRILNQVPRRAGELNPQLSAFFEELLCTLLEKNRDDRFASARDVERALEQGEDGDWWVARSHALRAASDRPLRRIRIPRETALYGRDEELARLDALFQLARGGDGQVLLLEGEAGIGKTRLVDEFVAGLREHGQELDFLFGSYPPGGAATVAGAFSTAYRGQFGTMDLETILAPYLAETPLLIPAFAALLRGDAPPKGAQPLNKESLQTVFANATQALAAQRPTIVLIDDLHFAPEEGRALFASLAGAVAGRAILLVGTMRRDVEMDWVAGIQRLPHSSSLELSRLGAEALARLLEDAFHSERLARQLGHRIALKTDGNPFFVFEILRGLREGNYLKKAEDGTWVTTQVIEEIEIPSSLLDLIQARLGALSEESADLLDVAACLGFEFDPLLVAEAVGEQEIPVLKRLGRIERKHRLVHSAGRSYVFDHHQVQEAIVQSMSPLLAERYHAALATAIEARTGAGEMDPRTLDGAICLDLCHHHLAGGRGTHALRYLEPALDHLEQGYQLAALSELANRALQVEGLLSGAARVEILMRCIGQPELLGRPWHEAPLREAYELATALEDPRLRGRAGMLLGFQYVRVGRFEEARAVLEDAIQQSKIADDPMYEGISSGNLGHAVANLESLEASIPYHERQLELARAHDLAGPDGAMEGNALANLGGVQLHLGRNEESQRLMEEAYAAHERRGSRIGMASALSRLGLLQHLQGRFGEARATLELALEGDRALGIRHRIPTNLQYLAYGAAERGRLADCVSDLQHALAECPEPVSGMSRQIRLQLAWALGWMGEPEKALAMAEEVRRELEDEPDPELLAYTKVRIAWFLDLLRRGAEAESHYRTALELARSGNFQHTIGLSVMELASYLSREGRHEEARPWLLEANEMGVNTSSCSLELLSLVYRSPMEQAEIERALELLGEEFNDVGALTALAAWGRIARQTGDPEHRGRGKELFDDVLAHAPARSRKRMVEVVEEIRLLAPTAGDAPGP